MEKTFEEYFNETDGKPFNYNGKTIQLSLSINTENKSKFRLDNFRTNSDWKQGIVIRALNGNLKFNETVNSALVFWENMFKEYIDFEFINGEKLLVYNVWDTGNGQMQSGHNGAGIFIENKEGKIMLNCNDAHPNAELNNLVFTISKNCSQ